MCLLFIYLNPHPRENEYILVLASVRDEFYYRPSRISHFWERNPDILGGMDFEEGKQGGTWLAMNRSGQIAALLNVVQGAEYAFPKKDRGFLVVNFLENRVDGQTYLREVREQASQYSPFLLVTFDVSPMTGKITAMRYSNVNSKDPELILPGVHVFGNSSHSKPWKKVEAAKYKFAKIIERQLERRSKEELIKDIFYLLADDTQYYPDEQLEQDIPVETEKEDLKKMSAIFINDVGGVYGSRTHTVILIDSYGHVDYVEKTMQEPIVTALGVKWVNTHLEFTIDKIEQLASHL